MTGRALSYEGRDGLTSLYGGQHPPAIAEQRQHARLVSCRQHPTQDGVVVVVEAADGRLHLIRATKSDAPELAVLSPSDRATVSAAVHGLHALNRAPPEDSTDAEGWQ